MNLTRLEKRLAEHEGTRLKPYKDSVGKLTIGIGRNLDDNGISKDEAYYMLSNDIRIAVDICLKLFQNFKMLGDIRQEILVEMAFQLGESGLSKFKKMIKAVTAWDFKTAAKEGRNSKWYKQVPKRAEELMQILETGDIKNI